jgi:dTDP-glucose pyrophosphorylase/CBS domain-containing protein
MIDLSLICLLSDNTLREAMLCIDRNAKGIALVMDAEQRLRYTITDGDLRRAVLHGLSLDMTVEEWAEQCAEHGSLHPTTAPLGTQPSDLLRLMQVDGLRHIPLIDNNGRVADLALLSDLIAKPEVSLKAVVMAGGAGTRLRPLTVNLPKPMLPVGNRPVIEHIVAQLREAGILQVSITTHYRPETIIQHFGNGQKFGVKIDYVNEEHPLGTAGALGLMPHWNSTLLVINGDILTKLNYQSMLEFHQENKAVVTVGIRHYDFQIPYGVVETEGVDVRQLREKPVLQFFVNAGVYLLEPEVYQYFFPRERLDMTDLISRLLDDKQRVVSFPISEYWLDVGVHADYEKAQADFERGESH